MAVIEPVIAYTEIPAGNYVAATPTDIPDMNVDIYTASLNSISGLGCRAYNDVGGFFTLEANGHGSGYVKLHIPVAYQLSINRVYLTGAGNDGLVYINNSTSNTNIGKGLSIPGSALYSLFPGGIHTLSLKAGTDVSTTHAGMILINFAVADTTAPTCIITMGASILY